MENIILIKPGDVFHRLTIVKEVYKKNRRHFLCKCECGEERVIRMDQLRNGNSKSCGCYNKEISKEKNTIHGMYNKRVYKIWSAMLGRCLNKNNQSYKNYGGRGIKVCVEWKKFEKFYSWALKNNYNEKLTIERIDVNGNYEPKNCKWATKTEQNRNTRKCKRIFYKGEILTQRQLAKKLGICNSTLSRACKKEKDIELVIKRYEKRCKYD